MPVVGALWVVVGARCARAVAAKKNFRKKNLLRGALRAVRDVLWAALNKFNFWGNSIGVKIFGLLYMG